jgi:hypothetical protein
MDAHATYMAVEDMIRTGESFERIEAFIDEHALNRDLANALWLLAWCESDADQRRGAIRELLGGLVV